LKSPGTTIKRSFSARNIITLEHKAHEIFDVLRIGYLIKEADERKEYDVIYGFSIIDNQVVQTALYYDDSKDKNWTIETWKAVKLKTK
jgi:hypothetical protein